MENGNMSGTLPGTPQFAALKINSDISDSVSY